MKEAEVEAEADSSTPIVESTEVINLFEATDPTVISTEPDDDGSAWFATTTLDRQEEVYARYDLATGEAISSVFLDVSPMQVALNGERRSVLAHGNTIVTYEWDRPDVVAPGQDASARIHVLNADGSERFSASAQSWIGDLKTGPIDLDAIGSSALEVHVEVCTSQLSCPKRHLVISLATGTVLLDVGDRGIEFLDAANLMVAGAYPSGLVAYSVETGAEVWRRDDLSNARQLGGSYVATTADDQTVSLDVSTGATGESVSSLPASPDGSVTSKYTDSGLELLKNGVVVGTYTMCIEAPTVYLFDTHAYVECHSGYDPAADFVSIQVPSLEVQGLGEPPDDTEVWLLRSGIDPFGHGAA